MKACFFHMVHFIRGHLLQMTDGIFFGLDFKRSFPIILWPVFFLSFASCDKEDSNLPNRGPFTIIANKQPICPGMQVQLYLFDENNQEIRDFNDFTFELSPKGMGQISSNGLYTAPESISGNSGVQITVKAKSNPKKRDLIELKFNGNPNAQIVSKIPHQIAINDPWYAVFARGFYGLSTNNEFLFGSILGYKTMNSFEVWVRDLNGQYKWRYGLSWGRSFLGLFFKDRILVSGTSVVDRDLNYETFSMVFDQNGTVLKEKIFGQFAFRGYYADQSGHLYLSNSEKSNYANPTQIIKLSPELDILQEFFIPYPVQSFLVNQDGSLVAFYSDELKEENGVVMFDNQGREKWNFELPYRYPNEARVIQINQEKYGLVKADCKLIPCAMELIYYEFGPNGELLNPGQTLVSSITLDMLIHNPIKSQDNFFLVGHNKYIYDILVVDEELLVVFGAETKKYAALMIRGTRGESLEYWWDKSFSLENARSLRHIHLIEKDGGIEWKTFCGQAICTFQLDKRLAFNPCF